VRSLPVRSYDFEVARSHTQLLVAARASGRRWGAHDLIINATARATRRTVVTTDDSDFDELPGAPVRKPAS
jgi:tRNA(fMet)-specific endonuclease VapC